MIILQAGRRTGKTRMLIEQAHKTNSCILTANRHMRISILNQAKEMGIEDLAVFDVSQLEKTVSMRYVMDRYHIKKMYIDELEMVLETMTMCPIEFATFGGACIGLAEFSENLKQGDIHFTSEEIKEITNCLIVASFDETVCKSVLNKLAVLKENAHE